MNTILKIAWRNIWRNPARSGVLMAAIMLGICCGVLAMSITNGLINQRFDFMIEKQLAHLQIHQPAFVEDMDVQHFIPNSKEIETFLNNDTNIAQYSSRGLFHAMITGPGTVSGAVVRAVYPEREIGTIDFEPVMKEGSFLESDGFAPIVVGQKLANRLDVILDDKLVLHIQDKDNQPIAGALYIAGIFESHMDELDENLVFIRMEDVVDLTGKSYVHEIAILLKNMEGLEGMSKQLQLAFPNQKVRAWKEISPELRILSESYGQIRMIFMVVILFGLAFGILNTMLMAVFERTKEIGVLLAIGMNKIRVFLLIITETIMISFIGAALGMLLAKFMVDWLYGIGVDLSAFSEGLTDLGFDTVIYPVISEGYYLSIVVMVFFTAVLAAFYPALKAIKLIPAEVIKK